MIGRDALRAHAPHQPLRHHTQHRRVDDEGRQTKITQSRNGADGIIGMHRGQHHVPGQRGLEGDRRRLCIADFADQHDIGILPQKAYELFGRALGLHAVPLTDDWSDRSLILVVRDEAQLSPVSRLLFDYLSGPL